MKLESAIKKGGRKDCLPEDLSNEPILHQPRWFKFGNICEIEVKDQMETAKELIGEVILGEARDDPSEFSTLIAKRRKASYVKFYRGEEARSRCYSNWDVPTIAHRFLDMWDGVQLSSIHEDCIRRRSFSSANLKITENDFRLILQ